MSDRLPEQVVVDRRKTHVGIPAERPTGRFRIAEHDRQFGAKGQYKHRSGWPYVVSILRDAQDRDGILIDDFVERTFATGTQASAVVSAAKSIAKRLLPSMVPGTIWKEPWVGIFHTPHRCPEWFDENAHPGMVITKWTFQESLPHLRGAIALSEYLAGWLRTQLSVPVVAIKHPTDFTTAKFSWEAFAGNPEKKLVQVGWYLRNYRAIYQVRAPEWIKKIHLAQEGVTIKRARARTDAHPVYGTRPDIGEVTMLSRLADTAYDCLLAESIVFMELVDASANNAIIESIVRETPVVVNRHPAVVEYLGSGYPLLYDDLSEVYELLTMQRIRAAHEYLKAMDKTELTVNHFEMRLRQFISVIA